MVNDDLRVALQQSPLLAGISDAALSALLANVRRRELAPGKILFRVGEPGNEFFIIETGRIQIRSPPAQGEQLINELGPGEWLGEVALITDTQRSATAIAVSPTTLLAVDRLGFRSLLQAAPSVALGLSYYLGHRLRLQSLVRSTRTFPRTIAVVTGSPSQAEAIAFANIAAALAQTLDQRIAVVDHIDTPRLATIVDTREFAQVIDAGRLDITSPGNGTDHALTLIRLSLTDPSLRDRLQASEAIWTLDSEGQGARAWIRSESTTKHALSILREGVMPAPSNPTDIALPAEVYADPLLVRQRATGAQAKVLRALARRQLGLRVGLVLSAGGAKGLAHLGALRSLERAGIEIDQIAGTSMGGLVGGLYALRRDSAALIAGFAGLARNFRSLLVDFGIPDVALLRGKKKRDLIARHTDGVSFENLPIPFWAVAADLASGREVTLGSGSLADALDATTAIPAVFPPVQISDQILVDGWSVNPLPADVLRRQGANTVIAIDTTIPADDDSFSHTPHARAGSVARSNRWMREPAIIRIAIRALEVSARERALAALALVDASVHPPVGSYSTTGVEAFDEIVERGEKATEAALPRIRQALVDSRHRAAAHNAVKQSSDK